jgi:pyridoxine/pyridoxamine 5'-phosphate oxidase
MDTATINFINNLTLAAAAIIAVVFLWRAYQKQVSERIEDLKEFNKVLQENYELRMQLIEQSLGVKWASRQGRYVDSDTQTTFKPPAEIKQ